MNITNKTIIAVNCDHISKEDLDSFTSRMKSSGKPSTIAGSFNKITDLNLEQLKHFKTAPYFWKPINGTIWGGMLADESINYIHLVLANQELVMFLTRKQEIEDEINKRLATN